MPRGLLLSGSVVTILDLVGQLTFVDVVSFDAAQSADVCRWGRLLCWLLLLPLWLLSLACGDG